MLKKQIKTAVIPDGFWRWVYKGQKVVGLDLGKFVRDVMRSCGYPCINCLEADCTEKDILNPNIRELIETLEARIVALETA